ncbi:right-handed parallel beta-helix repeat-containing protein [Candidatus Chloroploca sp. Khr17]|uniref:right-handed parallel beta-helix repeat-containing protein n=1 Tax=Candidatus Chloroploca sp. Khr17 TaxID=2496869 RepID=UPI00101D9D99|nr:right-handed parallel beta-helix repeat-containing protein [Candidatus Chloroploca sp. Khr17]
MFKANIQRTLLKTFRRAILIGLLLVAVVVATGWHLTGLTRSAYAQQCDISGIIASDRTLGVTAESCSTYNSTVGFGVAQGVTLTIEPGTILRLGTNFALTVSGTLIAQGTASSPIVFTKLGGNWAFIDFAATSVPGSFDADGAYTGGSILQHVIIEHAGGRSGYSNNGALRAENGVPYLDHLTVRDSGWHGISIFNLSRQNYAYRITNSTISNNVGRGIAIEGTATNLTYRISDNLIHTNNGGLELRNSGANSQGVVSNNTIRDHVYNSAMYVNISGAGSRVTIDNNTVTRNNSGGIYLSDSTNVVLEDNLITHNSNSASYGGGLRLSGTDATIQDNIIDHNNSTDGGGIYLSNSTNVVLEGNLITHNSASVGGGLYLSSADATIQGNTIDNNNSLYTGAAIYLDSNSKPLITFNEIISNTATNRTTGGIYICNGCAPVINDNDIYGNAGSPNSYDLYNANDSTASDIDATNNYWRTTISYDIETRIFHNFDDADLGLVNYQPFREQSVATDPGLIPTPRSVYLPLIRR